MDRRQGARVVTADARHSPPGCGQSRLPETRSGSGGSARGSGRGRSSGISPGPAHGRSNSRRHQGSGSAGSIAGSGTSRAGSERAATLRSMPPPTTKSPTRRESAPLRGSICVRGVFPDAGPTARSLGGRTGDVPLLSVLLRPPLASTLPVRLAVLAPSSLLRPGATGPLLLNPTVKPVAATEPPAGQKTW
jgi:hypothetical protein